MSMLVRVLSVLLLLTGNAVADATITVTLTGAGAANTVKTLVVSDADGGRLLTWAKAAFAPADGTTLTNKQAIDAVFDDLLLSMRHNVLSFEVSKAASTASGAVSPITPK